MSRLIADTAFVFAAGFGKRMLPLTLEIPKPMAKVAGRMMIEYALDCLDRAGIHNVVVNTYHLADVINPWLEERAKLAKPKILISHEKNVLLDTAGGIVQALPLLGLKPFFTINGDIIWHDKSPKDNVFDQMCRYWNPDTMDILMLLCPKEKAIGYDGKGDFGLTADGFITRSDEGNPYVYCGIQLIKPILFEGLPIKPFSLRDIYMARKRQDGSYHRMAGLIYDGQWLHVGTVQDIATAEKYLQKIPQ